MSNDECRRNDEIRMTEAFTASCFFRHSSFNISHSQLRVLRASVVIHCQWSQSIGSGGLPVVVSGLEGFTVPGLAPRARCASPLTVCW